MFCKFCGCEISDRAKVCRHCGNKTEKANRKQAKQAKVINKNSIAISGFVISLINFILCFVINIIVFNKVKGFNQIDNVSYVVLILLSIILIAVTGLILCFIGYKKSDVVELANLDVVGIVLDIIVLIITVIFLAVDIVDFYTLHFVPVESVLKW